MGKSLVNNNYPEAIYSQVIIGFNPAMDKYELRRLALRRLVDNMGRGAVAHVASAIGKDASYVSRMLAPPGKSGRKRIGEDSVEILNQKFPGWLGDADMATVGSPQESQSDHLLDAAYRAADEPTQVLVSYLLSNSKQRPAWMSPALAAMIDSTKAMVAEHFPGERRGPTDYPTGTDPKIGSW